MYLSYWFYAHLLIKVLVIEPAMLIESCPPIFINLNSRSIERCLSLVVVEVVVKNLQKNMTKTTNLITKHTHMYHKCIYSSSGGGSSGS